jgi:hypothetical protein
VLRVVWTVIRTVVSAFRSRHQLVLENLALRQQLAALMARGKRPRIRATDRAFWVLLRRVWALWADVQVIVTPNAVVRWHRAGFRLYWNSVSRRGARRGRSPVDVEARNLIRRMASENGWRGAHPPAAGPNGTKNKLAQQPYIGSHGPEGLLVFSRHWPTGCASTMHRQPKPSASQAQSMS